MSLDDLIGIYEESDTDPRTFFENAKALRDGIVRRGRTQARIARALKKRGIAIDAIASTPRIEA